MVSSHLLMPYLFCIYSGIMYVVNGAYLVPILDVNKVCDLLPEPLVGHHKLLCHSMHTLGPPN